MARTLTGDGVPTNSAPVRDPAVNRGSAGSPAAAPDILPISVFRWTVTFAGPVLGRAGMAQSDAAMWFPVKVNAGRVARQPTPAVAHGYFVDPGRRSRFSCCCRATGSDGSGCLAVVQGCFGFVVGPWPTAGLAWPSFAVAREAKFSRE
ncbi:hypothetical protein Acsp01_42270 [Actinoplanes sp. NBRC 101535]|nr:hypothetical protein Acsp01_42270 [Actinoplanes sp. NBRC 101535]